MKEAFYTTVAVVGAAVASAFGGWTSAMTSLLVFMAIDYITGIVVAAVFHASPKSENGSLASLAGWKGLWRKGMTLLIVLIAARLDILMGTTYCRDGVCIAFIANELLSIIENAGLMGVPIPKILTKAIEVLKSKDDTETE